METSLGVHPHGISRWKLFLALSRTPHGLLDLATPMLAALLQAGDTPPLKVVLLGALTAFAGYTAVYALNDVVDYKVDREDIPRGGAGDDPARNDLDAVYVRHPIAQGLLRLEEGILWAAGWALVALLGAYALNPVCAAIFLLGAVLECIYCLLLKVSYLRVIVSGVVKTLGAVAAVFAVNPHPSPAFLSVLFLWLFLWEIGGQNIPNDWTDMEEDRQLQAETVPVRFGIEGAGAIILAALVAAVALSPVIALVAPARLSAIYTIGALAAGFYFLLLPAFHLYRKKSRMQASALFNRSSHYPLAMFVVTLLGLI